MPKFMGILGLVFILLLSLLVAGCGILPYGEAEMEQPETIEEERLPEWLLSEHRGIRSAEAAEDDILPWDEEDENGDQIEETADSQPTEQYVGTQPAGEAEAQQSNAGNDTSYDDTESAGDREPETENVTAKSWQGGTYTGKWKDGKPNGSGTFYHPSGAQLTGNWVNGNPDGQVRFTDASGKTERITFDEGQRVEDVNWWNPKPSDSDGSWFD